MIFSFLEMSTSIQPCQEHYSHLPLTSPVPTPETPHTGNDGHLASSEQASGDAKAFENKSLRQHSSLTITLPISACWLFYEGHEGLWTSKRREPVLLGLDWACSPGPKMTVPPC